MTGVVSASDLRRELIVGGEAVQGVDRIDVTNPFDGGHVGSAPMAGPTQLELALDRADRAATTWRRWPAHARHAALSAIAAEVAARRAVLVRLIVLESGRTVQDASGEIDRCVFTFQYAAEEARRNGGEVVPMDLAPKGEGRLGMIRRFPVGPILGITPFNTPLNLVAHKLAPALAAGNPVIIKPALETPLIALELGAIAVGAGVPPELVSVLPMPNELAQTAVLDPRVAMLSFTGSTRTGWALRELVPRKRMTLELGGNAGVVVHEDADVDLAVEGCAIGAFNYAGQSCTSVQRVLVHERRWDEFVEGLLARVARLKVGDPMDADTDLGPMITRAAAERAEARIADAVAAGASLLAGGERDGTTVQPAVLADVSSDMDVVCEEVFAPIVSLQRYSDFHDAVRELDRSRYGLQAGIFTRDIERIFYAFHNVRVGGLMVNEVAAFRVDHMPYGGLKESGIGREGIRYAIEDMTEPRFLMLTHEFEARRKALARDD
jgi:acyl-CoA reductase-like NAD-dependent aldehyde dehydrogenase